MSIGIVASSYAASGGGSAWSPSDEGGLVAWFRVQDLSLSDNDSVTSWADQSGNSRTMTSSGASDPVYKTSITPGGNPVVRFNGSNNYMATSTFATDSTSSLWMFASVASLSANQTICYHGDAGANGYGIYMNSSNAFRGLMGGRTFFGTDTATTDFQNYGVNLDGGGAVFFVDNVDKGGTVLLPIATSSYGLTLGGYLNSSQFSDVDVCEIVYFDHDLDSTARSNLQTYFENKYL